MGGWGKEKDVTIDYACGLWKEWGILRYVRLDRWGEFKLG